MMDLTFEYLIIFILLFATNISLLIQDLGWNKKKFYIFTILYAALIIVFAFLGRYLHYQEAVVDYIPYVLGLVCLLVLISTVLHLFNWRKTNDIHLLLKSIYNIHAESNWKDSNRRYSFSKLIPFSGFVLASLMAIFVFFLSLNSSNMVLSGVELAILFIIVSIIVYKISRILTHAKRPYPVVIGEFMFLEFALLCIFALTYGVIRELDFSIFSSFLILTPTYQVFYMILILVFIMVLGVLYNNERTLKKLKRK